MLLLYGPDDLLRILTLAAAFSPFVFLTVLWAAESLARALKVPASRSPESLVVTVAVTQALVAVYAFARVDSWPFSGAIAFVYHLAAAFGAAFLISQLFGGVKVEKASLVAKARGSAIPPMPRNPPEPPPARRSRDSSSS